MSWRDNEVIFEGDHYKVIYNQNFIVRPFAVVERHSGLRMDSCASERQARAAVRHFDKQWDVANVR